MNAGNEVGRGVRGRSELWRVTGNPRSAERARPRRNSAESRRRCGVGSNVAQERRMCMRTCRKHGRSVKSWKTNEWVKAKIKTSRPITAEKKPPIQALKKSTRSVVARVHQRK